MSNRGKKIQCVNCGSKYYDLGQVDKPCPKCKNTPQNISRNKFNKKKNNVIFECWPRYVDVSLNESKQFDGWPVTVSRD